MRVVRPLSLLASFALAVGACSDAPTPTAATPGAPRLVDGCSGIIASVHVGGPSKLSQGQSATLTLTVLDTGGCPVNTSTRPVYWSSSSSSIVGITAANSQAATVYAYSAGNAVIYANVSGVQGGLAISVPYLATITLTPNPARTGYHSNAYFTATTKDQNGDPITVPITWTSSNTSIATINSSGVAYGVGRGTVTITASAQGKTATAPLEIIPIVGASGPEYVYEGSFTVTAGAEPDPTYYYIWKEGVCTNGEACTAYQTIAQGYNLTSVTRVMSRYDNYRNIYVEIRDSPTGPYLNNAVVQVSGGGEMNPNGSCFPAFECGPTY